MGFGNELYCEKTDVQGKGSDFTIPSEWTDGEVDAAILRWSQHLDGVCRTHFGNSSANFILSGDGTNVLFLTDISWWPIIAITKVEYRAEYESTDTFSSNGDEIAANDYRILDSRRGLKKVRRSTVRGALSLSTPIWFSGDHNYKITGTFGYKELPKPIILATALLVREEITPGSAAKFEAYKSERWPDGYQYTRATSGKTDTNRGVPQITGFQGVDRLIAPYWGGEAPIAMAIR